MMHHDQPCPRCGETDLTTNPMPEGHAHHASLNCTRCGLHRGWRRKPRPSGEAPPAEVRALVRPRPQPAPLVGSPKQIQFAGSIRDRLLVRAGRQGRPDLVELIRCVSDACWFLANRDRPLDRILWPRVDQIAEFCPSPPSSPAVAESPGRTGADSHPPRGENGRSQPHTSGASCGEGVCSAADSRRYGCADEDQSRPRQLQGRFGLTPCESPSTGTHPSPALRSQPTLKFK